MHLSYIFVIFSFNLLALTKNESVIKTLSPCTAELEDGRFIDLSALDDPNSPRYTNNKLNYSYNPCSSIDCGGTPSAICQLNNVDGLSYNLIAEQETAVFMVYNGSVIINFNSTNGRQAVFLNCKCSDMETFKFDKLDSGHILTYYFTFQSECCCPNGCKSNSTTSASTFETTEFITTVIESTTGKNSANIERTFNITITIFFIFMEIFKLAF